MKHEHGNLQSTNGQRDYFDAQAKHWDSFCKPDMIRPGLAAYVASLGLQGNEAILDLGCGTGILSSVVLDHLNEDGCLHAVDFSPAMLAVAQAKLADNRLRWHLADAAQIPLPDAAVSVVLCFSSWAHFTQQHTVINEMHRVLKPGGSLHIFHLQSKERINEIHTNANAAISHDLLPPASVLAEAVAARGFHPELVVDSHEQYLIRAKKRIQG
jgi:demethylmenaquinone methyltransferase/2-methoxy-6-polyprenyl-1,4-benzoquinol methylase